MASVEAPTRILPAVGTLRPDPTITVLIPAHNEAGGIAATLASLARQTRRPDAVIVVADNCTDDTVAIAQRVAQSSPIEISTFETRGNEDKKAGALNQALANYLPMLHPQDYVLVMDADSVLSDCWIEVALRTMANEDIGAVGGIFYGEGRNGLIAQLQRNEYVRYARDILRRKSVWVLTGTSSLFRVPILRQIAAARGTELPGEQGHVYDLDALTEDMEITLATMRLGYRCVSPAECATTTELMATWKDLWRQRKRWQRGAIDNLRSHGLNRITLPYMIQQAWAVCGFLVIVGYPALLGVSLMLGQGLTVQPFWLVIGALSLLDRIVTVRKAGWRGIVLTLSFLPEIFYDFFRLGVYLIGWWDALMKRAAQWHHATDTREGVN